MFFKERIPFLSGGRSNYRIPGAVTTKKGTVLLFCNNRIDTVADGAPEKALVVCRKELNGNWSDVMTLAIYEGVTMEFHSAVYDEETDTVMAFLTKKASLENGKEAFERGDVVPGKYIVESKDDGLTWSERPHIIEPNADGRIAYTHGSASGITLKHGKHPGRLLCPARYNIGVDHSVPNLQTGHFNSAIYSDDHGKTWKTSGPVQVGTGEGTLAELPDGTVYYNSRAYFMDGKRYIAYSYDDGETFTDFKTDDTLIEPMFGVNASLLHVEIDGRSMLLFANPHYYEPPVDGKIVVDKCRKNMAIQVSFDEGKTWPICKVVHREWAAYSSLTYNPLDKHFYLLYENGVEKGCYQYMSVAEFDLEWLLRDGQKMDGSTIILAAHRGDKLRYPENTMPAFQAAIDFGVDMIETDIHMTKDGVLVIMHDRNTKRTGGGVDRFINEMTLDEVKALDAGAWFAPEFAGTKVPTVEEFLQLIQPTNLTVNWELKDYPKDVGDAHAFEAADKLIELIEQYGMTKRSMLNSFSDRVLEHLYKQHGHKYPIHGEGVYRCKKTTDRAEIAEETMFDWCCMYGNESGQGPLDCKENFDYCIENKIIPCVCIPDTEENYAKALFFGCKMFTSNDIYTAEKVLKKLQVR